MIGIKVRVKPEVDKLVRKIADKLGYQPYTVRNTAILYGLLVLAFKIPRTDEEFLKLLKTVEEILNEEER